MLFRKAAAAVAVVFWPVVSCAVLDWEMHYVRLFHGDGSEIGGVLLFFFGGVSLGAALIWLITDFLGLGAVFFFFSAASCIDPCHGSSRYSGSITRLCTVDVFLCSVRSAFWELRKGMRFQMNQPDCTVE